MREELIKKKKHNTRIINKKMSIWNTFTISTGNDDDFLKNAIEDNESNTNPKTSKWILSKYKMEYSVILIILIITLTVFTFSDILNQDKKICTTKDCIRSATLFVKSMDKTVDPCENFYQFACGNYVKEISKSSENDRYLELRAKIKTSIKEFLEKDDDDNELYSIRQSRLLYRSCVATDEMDKAGLELLIEYLDKIGLPHLGVNIYRGSHEEKKNSYLSPILANIKKILNIEFLFQINVEADFQNRTINRISLRKPQQYSNNIFLHHKITENILKMTSKNIEETLNSEKAESTNVLKLYGKYVNDVWMEIFKFKSIDSYDSEAVSDLGLKIAETEILPFLSDFLNIIKEVYDTDSQLPTIMTVEELQIFTDNNTQNTERTIDWKQYFTILFMNVQNVTLDFKIDLIQVYNIEYFVHLFKLLDTYHGSNIITNIWWKVVTTISPHTTNKMRSIHDTYGYKISGIKCTSRSFDCADTVSTMMEMAVSYFFMDNITTDGNQNMMNEIVENIHWAFEKIVKEIKWMDEESKHKTLYKAKQMKLIIGFPEFMKDPVQVDKYYSKLKVIENDYIGNIVRYTQLVLNNILSELRKLNYYDKKSLVFDPMDVNAYSLYQTNTVVIPAGILQFPFIGHGLQSLDYGFFGSTLGHEITHHFDNIGREFDINGNNKIWWSNQTIKEYEKRANCFIQQYGSYLVPEIGIKIDGKFTLSENIADHGGFRQALYAYRKFVADHGEEPRLPGLEDYNNEQMYYLAYANKWCEGKKTNDSLLHSLADEHSPNIIRVIAGLINSEEFSEVWKCKKGTRMNPNDEKCKIW